MFSDNAEYNPQICDDGVLIYTVLDTIHSSAFYENHDISESVSEDGDTIQSQRSRVSNKRQEMHNGQNCGR
jgi:hypothetical protein